MQEIFKMTPHDKQVMMFSATLSKEIRPVCKKFMQDVMFHGQYYFNFQIIPFSYSKLQMQEIFGFSRSRGSGLVHLAVDNFLCCFPWNLT